MQYCFGTQLDAFLTLFAMMLFAGAVVLAMQMGLWYFFLGILVPSLIVGVVMALVYALALVMVRIVKGCKQRHDQE
ncbi:MAG: hypothetical protein A2942_04090 [Candidatus Lloydbacteria bacterium RIFCSPLOWO2_01_FULL_50_20]|uniref:Uncharacterized protein n=1 Tax=Candidatus Lloydbacteria bacterium RIFCSPLOWO2_01_FULL_50_20 TaxID=1798665 RepID=A0A1G2DCI9_9BACT|nr:MAG: hypothetical protein A3C13_01240 [Candidatus Lloydbacteria bacterium RIFCSPHIGHO2_02_FULL_50_11]OGZ11365.1 MAG: hypothetical protein A2942_04090 [Candidatus Lloydbacteria bacterium RIFCSPLOWO2_01_FULL_50_20]